MLKSAVATASGFANILHNFDRHLAQARRNSAELKPGGPTRSDVIMKTRAILSVALLGASLACPAEEANPFVKKKDEAKAKEAPAGPGFVGVVEHILVPPDLIDDWLRHNAAPTDATALRAEVQKWVNEGKATLDATVLASGVSGRHCTSEAILELTYQTDGEPNGPGVWPIPNASETRNTGYTQKFRVNPDVSPMRFSVEDELVEMTGSHSFHPLVEKTRLESDVFLPVIRRYRARSSSGDGSSDDVDPFTEPSASAGLPVMGDSVPDFELGKVAWLARFDPLPEERKRAAMSRLVFARGEAVEKIEKAKPLPEEFMTSVVTVKIAHKDFSDWVQSQKPSAILHSGWQFVETLRQNGKAEVVDSGNFRCRSSKRNTFENISEYIYPCEWEPVNRETVLDKWEERQSRKIDGKDVVGVASYINLKIESVPGLAGASIPAAFETRNTGRIYEIAVVPDESGALVQLVVEHVSLVGHSVHRRVEDEGKWVPDVTMPLFSTARINTTTRLTLGEWQLAGAGVSYNEDGKVDRDHCVLTFVKVE
jgi:hypothetical protein